MKSIMERARDGRSIYVVELAKETHAALQMLRAGRAQKAAHTPWTRIHNEGRNDPCHCGSGKKYKHCHGNKGE